MKSRGVVARVLYARRTVRAAYCAGECGPGGEVDRGQGSSVKAGGTATGLPSPLPHAVGVRCWLFLLRLRAAVLLLVCWVLRVGVGVLGLAGVGSSSRDL